MRFGYTSRAGPDRPAEVNQCLSPACPQLVRAGQPKFISACAQAGWAGLASFEDRPEILVVGKVSHDQLFRHGSVIIHHGGAGTTASALHAGVPQIIVPHFGDQFLWAREVRLFTGNRHAIPTSVCG